MHDGQKGYCKDLEESLDLGYSTTADIYYYGRDTHSLLLGQFIGAPNSRFPRPNG